MAHLVLVLRTDADLGKGGGGAASMLHHAPAACRRSGILARLRCP